MEFNVVKRLGDFQLAAKGRVEEGVTCVVGPNGSGKTTLMKILAGLLKPDSGRVEYVGVSSRVYVGDFYTPPEATGLDVVLAGRTRFGRRPVGREDVEKAAEYAELLEAADLLKRRISTLSGGQRQRLVIAAALASEADLLLLDEPLSNLHGDWRGRVMEVLRGLSRGRLVVVSTHHGDVLSCCHYVLQMENGVVTWLGPSADYQPRLAEAECGGSR
ncbi:ABC transporter, ATP-binding protein [Pyrobaculum ferrireducens]|uniref:ABC transporter, ATP-binding protein n=1 Tax=Pyrobaculum ferrireducens TaxID=1104324 RepID=G7VC30_9CREN|nr:ABC transporter, ATP-binding protein [Pyrobaculum ferrireducens]